VGTGTISAGTGTVVIPGDALAPGSHTLTVNYLGDAQNNPSSTTVRVTVTRASSTVAATVSPAQIGVKGGTANVHVTVSADGVTPTGVVGLFIGGSLVGGADLTDGEADLTVGPYPTLGEKAFQVRYLGDDYVRTSLVNKTVQVVKATPTMTVTTSPSVIRVNRTKPVVTVHLTAPGFDPVTGSVSVVSGGKTYTKTLSNGTAQFTLSAYKSIGVKEIQVTYLGTALTTVVTQTITVNVVR
jgi:5'-nucleotidase